MAAAYVMEQALAAAGATAAMQPPAAQAVAEEKPMEEQENKPSEADNKPMEEPENKPIEEPENKPMEEPENKPIEEPENKPIEETMNKPDDKPKDVYIRTGRVFCVYLVCCFGINTVYTFSLQGRF